MCCSSGVHLIIGISLVIYSPLVTAGWNSLLHIEPNNCKSLVVPGVNKDVWKALQRTTKEMDIALQNVQALLHKGLIPLLKAQRKERLGRRRSGKQKSIVGFSPSAGPLFLHPIHVKGRRKECGLVLSISPSQLFNTLLFGDEQEIIKITKQGKEVQRGAHST